MAKSANVWDNPGGTPGQKTCKIERGSEAWAELKDVLNDEKVGYLRISAAHGELIIKADEGMWSWPLDVEKPS